MTIYKVLRRNIRILTTILLVSGLLLHNNMAQQVFADEYIGCFRQGAGLVSPVACDGCALLYFQPDGGVPPTTSPYCPFSYTNEASAYNKCEPVPVGQDGKIVCTYANQIVALKYQCKIETDWSGIELQLAALGLLSAECIVAIAAKDPVGIGFCMFGATLWTAGNIGCTYFKCVGDPWVSTGIPRPLYQGLGVDTCHPES